VPRRSSTTLQKKPLEISMDISEYLKEPMGAALFGAAATALYIHLKAKLNNEAQQPVAAYAKPAVLVFILVYFIVSTGSASREKISAEPF
jgi:hypothetical protein